MPCKLKTFKMKFEDTLHKDLKKLTKITSAWRVQSFLLDGGEVIFAGQQ